MKLTGKTALVTGASKGIGKAIAHTLGKAGASVVITARHKEGLDAAAAELRADGISVLAVQADVAREADVARTIDEAQRAFGSVDILVNNAGMGVFKPVADMSVEEFDAMWNCNVRGAFLMTKGVLPGMLRKQSGEVVNIASLAGKNTFKGGAGYGATKWALRGFAGSLMLEVRDKNIRVITICPGSVNTEFSSDGKRGDNIPTADDVASAVLFAVTAPGRAMFSEIDLRPTRP